MAEYISKHEAIEEIKRIYCTNCNSYNGAMCRACEHMDDMDIIEDTKAADVQPVKHGRWSECYTDSRLYSGICSMCGGAAIRSVKANPLDYCPNCGARMDGDSECQ